MVKYAVFGRKDESHRPRTTRRGAQVRADLDTAYDPAEARPEEITEAKIDGICPRCNNVGDFGDEGYCPCGFAY